MAGPPKQRFAPSPRSRVPFEPTCSRNRATRFQGEGGVTVALGRFEIAGVGAVPGRSSNSPVSELAQIGPWTEPAQPVFAAYWLHNKGAAPLGYQPVTVRLSPAGFVSGPFSVEVAVASERTDVQLQGRSSGTPSGWSAEPAQRMYSSAPGAHLQFTVEVSPAVDSESGRYCVAARIGDEGRQEFHEDVVTVEYRRDGLDLSSGAETALSIDPATGKAVVGASQPDPPSCGPISRSN